MRDESDIFEDWIKGGNYPCFSHIVTNIYMYCFGPFVHTSITGHKRACLVDRTGLSNRSRPN